MRLPFLLLISAGLASTAPAAAERAKPRAQPADAAAPKLLGHFDPWIAATHDEDGQMVCYAFTYATVSAPNLPGRSRVVLTVTERPSGRDAVAISAGFPYAQGAEVTMQVDQKALPFYTSGRSAFARDGRQVVAAFERGRSATARSPGPRGVEIADTFSLHNFAQAYAAITKACPPQQ
jgi:hypothetical protein